MEKDRPIGVIDSGVGGLTVLKWLQKKMPHEQFIFIGDTARTPYGDRPREEIQRFCEGNDRLLGPSEDQGTGCCLQYHYGSWP